MRLREKVLDTPTLCFESAKPAGSSINSLSLRQRRLNSCRLRGNMLPVWWTSPCLQLLSGNGRSPPGYRTMIAKKLGTRQRLYAARAIGLDGGPLRYKVAKRPSTNLNVAGLVSVRPTSLLATGLRMAQDRSRHGHAAAVCMLAEASNWSPAPSSLLWQQLALPWSGFRLRWHAHDMQAMKDSGESSEGTMS